MDQFETTCPSPIGPLTVVVDDRDHLVRIDFPDHPRAERGRQDRTRGAHVVRQLREYFAGERTTFDVAEALQGTPIQQRAWRALMTIPFGQTVSYQEQARRLGNPAAMRAVGAANGRNCIPIVVPCHRVIGKDGSLTGFGGGLPIKQFLLEHERKVLATRGTVIAGRG